jgi:glycosyltransferase involved in cell wall biosynthesis
MHDLRILSPEYGDSLFASSHAECVERAAAVVTSWAEPRSQILARYPQLEPRLFTVSFPSLLPASHGPAEVRDRPYLLYPASTLPHKNHVRLLRAMTEVKKRHDVRLICTGPSVEPTASEVRATVRDLGLDDRVELLGYVTDEQLSALFRGCVGVVVPTLWEAASGAVMEGIDFGRPVACSNIESVSRQVADARARAALFDPLDVDDIARAMLAILDEPHKYTGVEDSGFGRLPTWPDVGRAYLDVFRWVVAGADPAARPFDRVGSEPR